MKPTNFKAENCESKSSNCIVWDGPDFECGDMKFCKGDNLTYAMYTMATEICALRERFDIANWDITCLANLSSSRITSFTQLIQVLINTNCSI
jgi:hypothetical protein